MVAYTRPCEVGSSASYSLWCCLRLPNIYIQTDTLDTVALRLYACITPTQEFIVHTMMMYILQSSVDTAVGDGGGVTVSVGLSVSSRLVGGGVSSARQRTLSRGSSVESDTNSSTIAGKCLLCVIQQVSLLCCVAPLRIFLKSSITLLLVVVYT